MISSTIQARLGRARSSLRRFGRRARRRLRRMTGEAVETGRRLVGRVRSTRRPGRTGPLQVLTPEQALQENGFYVFRGLFDADEARTIAARLKDEFGITGDREVSSINTTGRREIPRELLFEARVLEAVRQGVGSDARFLQVSDLQYNHDHTGWHRDSPYRGEDCSSTPDWSDRSAPYRVAKLIIYFECDNAGMGMLPGSHLDPLEMNAGAVRAREKAGDYTVISRRDEPNRRFSADELSRPAAWAAGVGDALLFDERMYHCGRRVEGDRVISDREGKKLTLSFVFGGDDAHSARMYSYFRYARTDLKYVPLPAELTQQLDERGLTPSFGWGNRFAAHPDELRGAYLRDPSKLDELLAQFSEAAAAS